MLRDGLSQCIKNLIFVTAAVGYTTIFDSTVDRHHSTR